MVNYADDPELMYISEGYNHHDSFLLAFDPFSTPYSVLLDNLRLDGLKDILHPFGINLNDTMIKMKGTFNGLPYLIDLIGRSEKEIVVVFACPQLDDYEFGRIQSNIAVAKDIFSREKDKTIFGGVAFHTAENDFPEILERQGFFLIKAVGSSSSIINQEQFIPKVF